jgi:hypothetical protein
VMPFEPSAATACSAAGAMRRPSSFLRQYFDLKVIIAD